MAALALLAHTAGNRAAAKANAATDMFLTDDLP
jgi:hypothetical protein